MSPSFKTQTQIDSVMAPRGIEHFTKPCNIDSCYHDLKCGHRVKTAYPDNCSPICMAPGLQAGETPFICQECIVVNVRFAMGMAILGYPSSDGVDMDTNTMTRTDMALIIAEKQITALKTKFHRVCVPVEKLVPLLQYYAEIPEAQDDGGFLGAQTAVPARKRPRTKACIYNKRNDEDVRAARHRSRSPGVRGDRGLSLEARNFGRGAHHERNIRRNRADNLLDNLVDHFGSTRVSLEIEDEATAAVRNLLEKMILEEKKPTDSSK